MTSYEMGQLFGTIVLVLVGVGAVITLIRSDLSWKEKIIGDRPWVAVLAIVLVGGLAILAVAGLVLGNGSDEEDWDEFVRGCEDSTAPVIGPEAASDSCNCVAASLRDQGVTADDVEKIARGGPAAAAADPRFIAASEACQP